MAIDVAGSPAVRELQPGAVQLENTLMTGLYIDGDGVDTVYSQPDACAANADGASGADCDPIQRRTVSKSVNGAR